jgi:hypothetical protein
VLFRGRFEPTRADMFGEEPGRRSPNVASRAEPGGGAATARP